MLLQWVNTAALSGVAKLPPKALVVLLSRIMQRKQAHVQQPLLIAASGSRTASLSQLHEVALHSPAAESR